mgnify:CR=1 FL=1
MNSGATRLMGAGLAMVLVAGGLAGCAAAVIGGAAAVGTLATVERRSAQTRVAANRANELVGERGRVNVVSYYRKVLLTGEVPGEDERRKVQAAVAAVPEVAGVVNELAVMPVASMNQQSDDTILTGRVKSKLLSTNGVPANSIKVVSERGTVYLMGRLTRSETELTTEAARTTPGVRRVVRVIDYISDQSVTPRDPAGSAAPQAPATDPEPIGAVTHPVTPPVIEPARQPVQVQQLPPVK